MCIPFESKWYASADTVPPKPVSFVLTTPLPNTHAPHTHLTHTHHTGVSYDQATVEKFGLNGNRVEGSPSYALMTDLSNRGIGYDVLITGLKKLHFGAALTDLGYRGIHY